MIVGLTGGVATGKSVIADELARLGAVIIDADRVGHEIIEPGTEAYAEVVEEFGPGVVLPGGAIDRKALGKIVFGDARQLAKLNSITHPRIIEKIKEKIKHEMELLSSGEQEPIIVVNAALLVESGHYKEMDTVVVISCTEAEQVRRSVERDGASEAEVLGRIAAQMPTEEKSAVADRTIENSGTIEEARQCARTLYEELEAEARRR
ncbi:MAG: dephospho-CoA kinase [Proteobacteria bacterium]|nr:dephospho-CoA kinase [Pseudomonadota bacterium]